jgi:signal transduction histidine kinase
VKMKRIALFPARYALFFALFYSIFSLIWIRYSTTMVGYISTSVEESARLELYKGYGFIVTTGLLFYFFSLAVFKKMSSNAQDILESQQRLIQAERDALSGLLVSSVAHDITNLVTIFQLNTERLSRMSGLSEPAKDSVTRLERAVLRMVELSSRMRNAGRNVLKDKPRSFNLRETVEETLNLISSHKSVKGCAIQVDSDDKVMALGYPILVHQLVINLVLNAAEATGGRGRILIRLFRRQNGVEIEVHDDGPSVDVSVREQVFDAFYTTKQTGTGLGLMSVKSCVEIHGGSVSIRDSDLGGAAFCVILPDFNGQQIGSVKPSKSLNKTRATPSPQMHT